MTTRNGTLFQIKSGHPDEASTMEQKPTGTNYQLAARLTKSKTGNFLHYYRNLGSTSFSAADLVPAKKSGKKLSPVSRSILEVLMRYRIKPRY
jgi:hypothetical protein